MDQYYTRGYKSTGHADLRSEEGAAYSIAAVDEYKPPYAQANRHDHHDDGELSLHSTAAVDEFNPPYEQDNEHEQPPTEYMPADKKEFEAMDLGVAESVTTRDGMGLDTIRRSTRVMEKASVRERLAPISKLRTLAASGHETNHRLFVKGWSQASTDSAQKLEKKLWDMFGGAEKGVVSCQASQNLKCAFVSFASKEEAAHAVRMFCNHPKLYVTWKRVDTAQGFTRVTKMASPERTLPPITKLWAHPRRKSETDHRLFVNGWKVGDIGSAAELEEKLWDVFGGTERGVVTCRAHTNLKCAFVSFATREDAAHAVRIFRNYPGLHVEWKRGLPRPAAAQPVQTKTNSMPASIFYAVVNIYHCADSRSQSYSRVLNYLNIFPTAEEAWTYTLNIIADNVFCADNLHERQSFMADNTVPISDHITRLLTLINDGSRQRVIYHVGNVGCDRGQSLEADLAMEDNGIVAPKQLQTLA